MRLLITSSLYNIPLCWKNCIFELWLKQLGFALRIVSCMKVLNCGYETLSHYAVCSIKIDYTKHWFRYLNVGLLNYFKFKYTKKPIFTDFTILIFMINLSTSLVVKTFYRYYRLWGHSLQKHCLDIRLLWWWNFSYSHIIIKINNKDKILIFC